uniref:C2H2-type domain-containing protein n=1 Tax=Scophthalmus maximus TaxID=52904 RepID=A0A8D3CJV2_SCOMX
MHFLSLSKEVFPAEYGPQYDGDLQTLFGDFLCRLTQLLPVPDLEQVRCQFNNVATCMSHFTSCNTLPPLVIIMLLLYNPLLPHALTIHSCPFFCAVPPSSMGDSILSSLSTVLPRRVANTTEQPNQSGPLQGLSDETHHVSFVDDVAVEIITVTDYAEVELGASTDVEAVLGEHCYERTERCTETEDSSVVPPEKTTREDKVDKAGGGATRETVESGLTNVIQPEVNKDDPDSSQHKVSVGPHDCPDCEKKFKFASSLIAHRVIHTGERPHRCNDCGRCFSFRQSLDRHRHTHKTGRKYDCAVCGKTFRSLSARTDGEQAPCEFGGPVPELNDHQVSPVKVRTSGRKRKPTMKIQVINLQNCGGCEKSFKFQSLLKAHQRIHTGEQPFLCSQCGCRFSFKQSLERHRQTHKSGRKYECLICGEFFKSLVAQREHKSTHMENGEYLCSECGRAFAWKSALVRHLKIHGEDADQVERSFKCPHCDLGFSCVNYLNRHLQTHQEERKERPHTCTQCGKGFLYKGGLLSHMKIHSEEMPFMCSFCGKSFKRERSMKKHERCHTRENVFGCSQCDKSFVYKATLTRHELTHSGERPYLCSDCGKGFFSHAELLKHERFHTGHKPFQCPHCDKKFTHANRLKRHQRTHSGEKPYLCVECGKGFRQSYNLKMHQRTHIMKLTFTVIVENQLGHVRYLVLYFNF